MLCKKDAYFFTKKKTQNFRLVQIQSICRQQNVCGLKIEKCLGDGKKHFVKRKKCWLPAFSPFHTMFSKGFFLKFVKSWDCAVKGECICKKKKKTTHGPKIFAVR